MPDAELLAKLTQFFREMWDAARGVEPGGDTVQEIAERLGLLTLHNLNAPCGEGCVCADDYGCSGPTECYWPFYESPPVAHEHAHD